MTTSLRRARASALLTFLLAALVSLVALPALSAHSAPLPTLTATPNPVIVPDGQTMGTYTLAWTTGGLSYDLYVTANGGAPFGPIPAPTDGSGQFNINVGDVLVWNMYPKGTKETSMATVTVTARHVDSSCKTECIKLAQVTPHGTFAQFKVVTNGPKKITAELHLPNTSSPMWSQSTPAASTWMPNITGLKPNTAYDWSVTVTDEAGNSQIRKGSTKTLRRQVTVTYNPIAVIDDSDDLSAGELEFFFGLNGVMDQNKWGTVSVSSGGSTSPNHVSTIMDAPDSLGLVVSGIDDDCDWFELCSLGGGPITGPLGSGSSSLADWATATSSVNVYIDGPGEAFTSTKTFGTTGFALKFSVKATFIVSYL